MSEKGQQESTCCDTLMELRAYCEGRAKYLDANSSWCGSDEDCGRHEGWIETYKNVVKWIDAHMPEDTP